MKVLLPEGTELQGFERELKITLEQAHLAGYALMGFAFREVSSPQLHEIDALLVMEPGIFVCLEAKGYEGRWTGSANQRWLCDDKEIKAGGGNPYKQVREYSFVIKNKLTSGVFNNIDRLRVYHFVVAPDKARFDIDDAIINTFQPQASISICHLSRIANALGIIKANEQVASKFMEVGSEKIISELTGISLERLEKIINGQPPEAPKKPVDTTPEPVPEAPKKPVDTTPEPVPEAPKKPVDTTPEPVPERLRRKPILLTCLVGLGILTTAGTGYFLWNKRPSSPGETAKPPTPIITTAPSSGGIEGKKIEATTLTIGILSKPSYYQELTTYLRSQFSNKVQIVLDGDESISYEEARKRIINKEWDIAFPQSPMLSIAAKNNGYSYAARMFPDSPPYYQATLFTKSNSSIKSISDLIPTHTIAMGDFNSASSFYVAAYDLYGKTLKVNMGHKSSKIKELVKTGQADIGAAAYIAVKDDKDLRIIHLSKLIPGGNVYLSPKLSESDRHIITQILLNAPANIRKQANYGADKEQDYSQLIKISERTEKILECNPFAKTPVNFYCDDKPRIPPVSPGKILEILGKINGWTKKGEFESFKLLGDQNKVYEVIIPEKIFNQIPDAPNPIAIQGQNVKIINVIPQKQGGITQLKITEPNQFIVLKNISQSATDSNYQVKQVDDGDTITVTDVSNQEMRVRFACIDTAEVPHSDTEKTSDNPADKNQFLWGNKAKERLESIIKIGDRVKLNIVDTDRYGRKVAEVRLEDGTFIQQILVKEGLAMVYRQYLKNCASAALVEQAEAEAKQQRLNIWADSQFTAPWDWRSQKRAAKKS